MKIGITAQGKQLESLVDPRFGRAKWFAIIDTETGSQEFVDNSQNLGAAQGAGIQAASNVARLGVQAVVTGNVGPKAFATLNAAGIKVYLGASGTIQEALNQFTAGTLELAGQANVGGHWV